MRAQILHLSGPLRGRTVVAPGPLVPIGTARGAEIRFGEGCGVEPRHAEIAFHQEGCSFHLRALDGDVFVNQRQIREIVLEHGDLIELGRDGPKLRFRIQVASGEVCKPVRQMLNDARDVGRSSGLRSATAAFGRDLFRHATPRLKLGVPLAFLALVFVMAGLGGWLGSQGGEAKARTSRQARERLHEHEIAQLRDQLDHFRRTLAGHVPRDEVLRLRADLEERARVVDALLARNRALKTVLEVYSRGVCLVHGIFGLEAETDGAWELVAGPDGDPVQLEYVGSGFLASEAGDIVTNRHVAEPWWENDAVQPLLDRGLRPRWIRLEVCFPGRAPADVDKDAIRVSEEGVDVAVLRAPSPGIPVLPLEDGDPAELRGERVVLLGYPTGVNALMARADPETAEQIRAEATDTTSLIVALARHDAIVPVITQGALNDVAARRLVYDAETTSGGSGGPVFGPGGTVIGVNFAITRDFDGSNFGIPIAFARRLLP